jgi:SRSO17 transposase
VEEFLEDSKSYLGMTQYETRSYVGWHHHMTLDQRFVVGRS